ncbi:MAG: GNAT family N-acetyltransferase [Candidatus Micrarchaeota archaeon]|nr:GNAT family N-acetyltransferase [Candidatus Micrarchaeota archaeon]
MSKIIKKKQKIIVRSVRRRDLKDLMYNYVLVQKEIRTNPYIGIPLSDKKPTLKSERKWLAKLIKEVKEGKSIASVAEVDGRVVGMCDITPSGGSPEARHMANLGILVRKGYRSMGIGTMLIESSLEKARKKYKAVKLDVFGFNKGAQKLYKRFGFKTYGVLPSAFIRGKRLKIDKIMMYLEFN